jgi:hypothetical protein
MMIRWRGTVASTIRGKRGQAFLRELIDALDAMPDKRLVDGALHQDGAVCAIGAVGVKRGVEMGRLDPDDYDTVAATFGIAVPLVREIEWENDEGGPYSGETPEQRWTRMRAWAVANLKKEPSS